MKISVIRIPFRVSYGHKQKTHASVHTVICQITDEHGNVGLGEAVPRTYVTGETVESVFHDAQMIGNVLIGQPFSSPEDIKNKIVSLSSGWEQPYPSCAFCCVDLALHDCLAQNQEKNIGAYFGAGCVELPYTASIGLSNKTTLFALLMLYRLSGIRSFKLKVGDEHDLERLQIIKNMMGKDTAVFADANGAWNTRNAPEKINQLADSGLWAIEEPLSIPFPSSVDNEVEQCNRDVVMDAGHFEKYEKLRPQISIPVILDESLISQQSYTRAIESNAVDILNIRLSKLGGYSMASHMIKNRPDTVKFSIGAMVGESPILAAAGYFFGCVHSDHLYIQGYSHRILHRKTFTSGGPAMKHGKVKIRDQRSGLGIKIKPESLRTLTIKEKVIRHGEA